MNDYFFKLFCLFLILTCISSIKTYAIDEKIILENNTGIKVVIPKTVNGYSFGTIYVNDIPIEKSLLNGMLLFKDTKSNNDIWLYGSDAEKINNLKYRFSGAGSIDGSNVSFNMTVSLPEDINAINITYDFKVDKDIQGRQACLSFHNEFMSDWKCHMYPWVADSRYIQRDPLTWPGIPSLIMYRDDMSVGLMWGIDPNSDYLNPTTWTKDFGLYFINGQVPVQYRVGGRELKTEIEYSCPMQLIISDQSDPDIMITELVQSWMKNSDYKVEKLFVRSNDEALNLFIQGRKNTSMWYPGKGYRLEMGDPSSAFIYIGEQGVSALFDYMLYELTDDALWRQRSFEQMDFILTGQITDLEDPLYGYIHTAFSLVDYGPAGKGFNSYDRGSNPGYKVDLNVYLGLYMLKMWERVKIHEGIDNKKWHDAAIRAIDWAVSQQNSDGGFPQKLSFVPFEYREGNEWMGTGQPEYVKYRIPGEKSISTTSGRALPALWNIYNITGNEKYKRIMEELEKYTLKSFQNKYLFNSHHPDLPPHTLEEASIWGVCEYWLYRYEETNENKYLKHAVANAHLSLTWKCPKQLSWVDNPTQLGSVEQQYFLQYSVYCYQNRQVECLKKLYDFTNNDLYKKLEERITQNVFWTQISEGNLMGATHEAIADPWLAREKDNLEEQMIGLGGKSKVNGSINRTGVNETGTVYMSEQSLDLLIQIVEMYRTGEYICSDESIINKSYASGLTYYSKNIKGKEITSLRVIPSQGSVNTGVKSWSENKKVWILNNNSDAGITINHIVDSLIPGSTYHLQIDNEEIATYQTTPKGSLEFSLTDNFVEAKTIKLIKRN
jgi:hypothetical protein